MPNRHFQIALLGSIALVATAVQSAPPSRAGKPTASARSSVHKPGGPAGGHAGAHAGGPQRQAGGAARQRNAGGYQGGKPQKGGRGNNVVAGNTVVVGGQPGNGYYDNGRYHDRPDWDDDDNEVLEFMGKTAAITAGVSIVTAVIGSTVKDQPQGCQPVNAGGQQMLSCNGTYYQPVSNGYQVVAPPPGS